MYFLANQITRYQIALDKPEVVCDLELCGFFFKIGYILGR